MIDARTSIADLAADHALGLTEAAELERAERLMATDSGFARMVEDFRSSLSAIDETATPLSPPKDLFDRIEKTLAAPARPAAAPLENPGIWAGLWSSLLFWRNAAIGAAAALVLATGLGRFGDSGPTQPVYVAVLQNDAGQSAAVVNAFADGTVMLVPIQTVAVPQGRIIEVWTLQDRAQGPVSIGRMDQARTIKLDLKSLPKAGVGHLFEMTIEPAGGSPTGKPTGPIVAKGLAAQRL
jgi:anti-sigma-K factor RskA